MQQMNIQKLAKELPRSVRTANTSKTGPEVDIDALRTEQYTRRRLMEGFAYEDWSNENPNPFPNGVPQDATKAQRIKYQEWSDLDTFEKYRLLGTTTDADDCYAEQSLFTGQLDTMPSKPYAQVSVIPERGMKCRVVTKSPAALVTWGDQLRKVLFKGL